MGFFFEAAGAKDRRPDFCTWSVAPGNSLFLDVVVGVLLMADGAATQSSRVGSKATGSKELSIDLTIKPVVPPAMD